MKTTVLHILNMFLKRDMAVIFMTVIFLTSSAFVRADSIKNVKHPVSHPKIGEYADFGNGRNKITLVNKLQNYMGGDNPPRDNDIYSPKSVNIHPSGTRFYVNSLEGGKTIAYSLPDLKKLAVIEHKFSDVDSLLWAKPSGLFKFRHYTNSLNTFTGKPVESEFSHNGRYLWVPYYRRSYDINAQDPSAVAVIDTESNRIVRMMEAGVLPKMIAVSPDGKTMAVTHWGDNTVGLIDISSKNPEDWKYIDNIAVGHQLFHNFSLTTPVDRDHNTGEALRGTVFTPDGRYLLIGCMSGGGIAVIDVKERKYLGKILGMMPNLRHLVIKGDKLYLSINASGYVQRIPLSKIIATAENMKETGTVTVSGWESCKVNSGARTLEVSPKGDYIFVACNLGSAVCVVDSGMNQVARLDADSFPVGLAVSPDGKWLITTSQGRKGSGGGNCVDIYSIEGLESDWSYDPVEEAASDSISSDSATLTDENSSGAEKRGSSTIWWCVGAAILCVIIAFWAYRKKK